MEQKSCTVCQVYLACIRKAYWGCTREASSGGDSDLWGGQETNHCIESRQVGMRLSEGGRHAGVKACLQLKGTCWVSTATGTGLEAARAQVQTEGGPYLLSPGIHSRHRGEVQMEKNWQKEKQSRTC